MKTKRKTGNIIVALGIILIAVSLVWTGYNLICEKMAEKSSEEALMQMELDIIESNPEEVPDYILDSDREMPVKEINGKEYVGAVSIPALELDLPVISNWSYQNFRISPCRYEGTPYKNNMILCAHNYRKHFASLRYLTEGDRVYFTDMDKNKFSYEVMYVEVIDRTAVEQLNAGDWDLTLFTCTYGGATRVVVRCRKV